MKYPLAWLAFSIAAWGMTGCHKEEGHAGGKGTGNAKAPTAARPGTPVDVVEAITAKITEYREFTGRTGASHSVEVRPRVSGYLEQAPLGRYITGNKVGAIRVGRFQNPSVNPAVLQQPAVASREAFLVTAREGDRVEANTPLFEIDPRPYLLALEQAQGNREAASAQQVRLRNELSRLEKLKQTNSISDSDLDLARANLQESIGQVQTLDAAVKRAELDLEFTRVYAPISGIIGRSLVTRANVVNADSTILTTIVASDPVHVFFDVDEGSFLRYRELVRSGKLLHATMSSVPVSLGLFNDTGFPYQGTIDFQNNTTDPGTGNTLIRAEFSNSDGQLTPGLYCKVKVPFSPEFDAVMIPTKCLAMDQQGRYVMAIEKEGEQSIATRRTVAVGTSQGGYTVITSGLTNGEMVVYEGLQRIRPKDPVSPIPSKTAPAFQPNLEG